MITVDPLKETNISYLLVMSDEIDMNPTYQREGDIWPLSKKQLFIDSLLNGIDVPKLYFHELKKTRANKYQYAVVDGKQRLDAVFSFLQDHFALSDDFEDYSGEFGNLAGKKYSEFGSISSKLKARFDAKQLPIYVIRTDDEELIEEMFYRLNEAAPLNAAEKRNSTSGPFPKLTKEISQHSFFKDIVPFSSHRFRHYDAIAKLLLISYNEKIVDTKKIHLDTFAKSLKTIPKPKIAKLKNELIEILNEWVNIFEEGDALLKSPSNLPVYLVAYSFLKKSKKVSLFKAAKIRNFEKARLANRLLATKSEPSEAINFKWLEFDRLIQSPNDSSSIRFRASELLDYLGVKDAESNLP